VSQSPRRLVYRSFAPGFPKTLPCLVCDRPRPARSPGDRIHPSCRKVRSGLSGPEYSVSIGNHNHSKGDDS